MKKIIAILFMLFICSFIFVGCEKKNSDVEKELPQEEPKEEPQENQTEEPTPKEVVPGSLYIRYVLNNGKPDVITKVSSLDNYHFAIPKSDGHTFEGWYKDEDLTFVLHETDLEMPTDENDITVYAYAEWSTDIYDVTFKYNDEVISLQHVMYGASAKEPVGTFKSGYRFVGWDKDFSNITKDTVINAIYEKNTDSKNIMVVLGNWMNNDGTISATMKARLDLALKAYSEYPFDYIVVTGGMANSVAGISEAQAMYDYLTKHGLDSSIIIKEDQSMSTQQNATYTMKKLENIDFKNLVIVSTIEHFVNYQTIKYFNDAAKSNTKIFNKNINIMIYTNNGAY